jgi:PAS domain S-box-containing protein
MSFRTNNVYSGWMAAILLVFMFVCSPLVAEPAVITVGVYEQEPKVYLNKDNQPAGFFVELIEEIGRVEGWKIKYKLGTWDECLSALDNSEIDIMVDVAFSEARRNRWNFNKEPVLSDWFQIYTGNESKINSIVDLTGKKVAVLNQSVQADALKGHLMQFGLNCELVLLPDYHKVFQLLAEGKVDAAVVNRFYGAAHMSSNIRETGIIFHPTRLHFAASKNSNPLIISALDKHLVKMKIDRESFYYRSLAKWFAEEPVPYGTPTWLKQTIGGLASFIIIFIGLSLFLKMRIKEKTSDLLSITEKLRVSEEQYRELFDNAPSAYFTIDAKEGRVKRCNVGAQKMLGYTAEVLEKMNVLDLYMESPNGKEKAKEILERFKQGESIVDEELQMISSDGKPIWVSLSVESVKDLDGNIIESRSIAVNISNRKELEKQLLQTQKMEALGVLSGGIAHDFNNILSAIIGYTELAKADAKSPEVIEYLTEVQRASDRATSLVQQILTFSRETEQIIRPLQPKVLIKETIKLLRASLPSNIKVKQSIDSDSYILADPTQIHQIMMNLCTNSWHAMEEHGGTLQIGLSDIHLSNPLNTVTGELEPGDYIKLSTKDNGIGIPDDIIDLIFDPFFTTKAQGKGTGMGLSVVHGIISKYKGGLTLERNTGEGVTINIYFHVTDDIDSKEKSTESTEISSGEVNILFVDDEEPIAKMVENIFLRRGCHVTRTSDPLEALNIFSKKPDFFDVVITDQMMPDVTGENLAASILELRENTPIILCTGYINEISEERIRQIGIKKILAKPLNKEKLIAAVNEVLDKQKL